MGIDRAASLASPAAVAVTSTAENENTTACITRTTGHTPFGRNPPSHRFATLASGAPEPPNSTTSTPVTRNSTIAITLIAAAALSISPNARTVNTLVPNTRHNATSGDNHAGASGNQYVV